jgi:hypothetical protein
MLALLPAVNVSIVSTMHVKLGVMVHRGSQPLCDNVQTDDQRGSKARNLFQHPDHSAGRGQ